MSECILFRCAPFDFCCTWVRGQWCGRDATVASSWLPYLLWGDHGREGKDHRFVTRCYHHTKEGTMVKSRWVDENINLWRKLTWQTWNRQNYSASKAFLSKNVRPKKIQLQRAWGCRFLQGLWPQCPYWLSTAVGLCREEWHLPVAWQLKDGWWSHTMAKRQLSAEFILFWSRAVRMCRSPWGLWLACGSVGWLVGWVLAGFYQRGLCQTSRLCCYASLRGLDSCGPSGLLDLAFLKSACPKSGARVKESQQESQVKESHQPTHESSDDVIMPSLFAPFE